MIVTFLLLTLGEEDRDFITRLYETHKLRIYAIALGILKNEADAADALQETMCRLIRFIDKFPKTERAELHNKTLAILNITARNTARSLYSKRKRRSLREAPLYFESDGEEIPLELPDDTDLEAEIITEDERRTVQNALSELSPELADAVKLVYFCELSTVEAARLLGIKEGTLRKRLFDARSKLKERLKGEL